MHMQTLYKSFHKHGDQTLKTTEEVTGGILSLPIYETLSDATIETVAQAIHRLHNHAAKQKQESSGRQHVNVRS